MTEILDTLAKYIWIGDFFTLCVLAILALKLQQNNSSLMTQLLVIVLSGTIIKYEPLVNSFMSPDVSQSVFVLWCIGFALFDCVVAYVLYRQYNTFKVAKKPMVKAAYLLFASSFMVSMLYIQYGPLLFGIEGPSYKVWRLVAYYLGTAVFDCLAIYAIYQTHLVSKKSYSLIARMYLLAFLVAASIQTMRFIELYVWETRYLKGLYQWGLASINVSTSVVAVLITCLAIYQYYSGKTREGVLWNL